MYRLSFKYNLTFIVLFFGFTLVHAVDESEGGGDGGDEPQNKSNEKIKLYYTEFSAQCRSVMMIGEMLNIEFDMIPKDLEAHEQYDPEYEKIHPLRQVPAIDDNGFILWESRAIMVYLVQKYGKEKRLELFPEELQAQANVNKMLQFDMGTLTDAFVDLYSSWIFFKSPRSDYKQNNFIASLELLEKLLEHEYVTGNSLTVADVALVANIVTIQAVGESITEYPKISNWLTNCKAKITKFNEVNDAGLKIAEEKARTRREAEEKDFYDGKVTNRDVFTAISTLLRGVRSQVVSTKYHATFQKIFDSVSLLVKA